MSSKKIIIFISYATVDSELFNIPTFAELLKEKPQIGEVLYWQKHMTENIYLYMSNNLEKCDVFLIFCTQQSKNSEPVQHEWTAAIQGGKKIIPIFINPKDMPMIINAMLGIQVEMNEDSNSVKNLTSLVEKVYNLIIKTLAKESEFDHLKSFEDIFSEVKVQKSDFENERIDKLKEILKLITYRYNSMGLTKFADLLEFDSPIEAKVWLSNLYYNSPLKLKEVDAYFANDTYSYDEHLEKINQDIVIFEENTKDADMNYMLEEFQDWKAQGRSRWRLREFESTVYAGLTRSINNLSLQLGFKNPFEFESWLLELPESLPIRIDQNLIYFDPILDNLIKEVPEFLKDISPKDPKWTARVKLEIQLLVRYINFQKARFKKRWFYLAPEKNPKYNYMKWNGYLLVPEQPEIKFDFRIIINSEYPSRKPLCFIDSSIMEYVRSKLYTKNVWEEEGKSYVMIDTKYFEQEAWDNSMSIAYFFEKEVRAWWIHQLDDINNKWNKK